MTKEDALVPAEILLVEDNPGDVRLTREALKEARPCNLNVVVDGEAALAFLRHEGQYASAPAPELVLLDLNLSRKDGREVLAEIKEDPTLRRIPVVVLTTSSAEKDVVQAYNLHVNCYITKPPRLDEFLSAVKSIADFWLGLVTLPPKVRP